MRPSSKLTAEMKFMKTQTTLLFGALSTTRCKKVLLAQMTIHITIPLTLLGILGGKVAMFI